MPAASRRCDRGRRPADRRSMRRKRSASSWRSWARGRTTWACRSPCGPSGNWRPIWCAAGWSRSCMPPRSAASCATRASRSNARRPGRRAPIRTSPPKKRVCALYRAAPPNGRVICFDEFGPIEVRPYHGRAWRQVRHPARLRATYRRSMARANTSRPTTSKPIGS